MLGCFSTHTPRLVAAYAQPYRELAATWSDGTRCRAGQRGVFEGSVGSGRALWLGAGNNIAAELPGWRMFAAHHPYVIARLAGNLDLLPPLSAGSDYDRMVKEMSASPGIVVLDRSGRISFATDGAATLLQLGDGLTVRGGRLVGRQGASRLEDSIQAILTDPLDAPSGPLRTVVLRRRDQLPLIATLAPLASAATGPLGALVLLHDPEAALRPATEVLRQAFGLTVAEAAVAQALLHGATPRQIAEQRQVSLNTIRTLVARVLGKTGTHRQADLVRLLLPLATAEAVRAGFEAGFRLGAVGGALASWPLRPAELLRADLALAGRQEARVALSEYAPGKGTPVHQHGDAHEIVYLLGGSLQGEWGTSEGREAGAGELLHYGPGLLHRGTNRGAATARMLVTRIVRLDPLSDPTSPARHKSV